MGKVELLAKIKTAIEEEWPIQESPEAPMKTFHLLLVGFDGQNLDNFYPGITTIPDEVAPWWARFGLKVKNWETHKVILPNPAKDYNYWTMTWELLNNGTITMDGESAWYILTAQKTPWPLGGTIGGDWFKQTKGQVPGRGGFMRVPGISWADYGCTYALRYNRPPPGAVYPQDRNNVLGWMMHEVCHSCALIPCRCGHATNCIMDQGCYRFPDGAVIGCDNPWILGPTPGDEIAELIRYGFMERV